MDYSAITQGIYFGMPENIYHATPHLGSSSVKQLYASPPDYWFGSHMNPLRELEEDSNAFRFGTALHHRILHGEAYFKAHYTPLSGGNKDGSIEAQALKDWIASQGGVPSKLKSDNERMVAQEFGTTLIAQKVYEKIMVAAQMILKNPHLAQAFVGGWPEVSVFWQEDGVPCKARFDYLKSGAIVDLKSFASKQRITQVDKWITNDLYNYRYDLQAAHYMEAYVAMAGVVKAGAVYAAPDAPRPADEWLMAAAGKIPQWAFVFYKTDGMPLSKSYQIANGGFVHGMALNARKLALDNYRDNLARFGTDPWVNMDEPYMLDQEDVPKWAGF